ncbi:MAG TPA: LutB/LldF family L-lactate oxidation iron-sulfur protein [Verrucomicrobiae bacterium]|jgi:L-lactate dehydrogenase complex protein LldF|nr:LutB/LldF family L-lactate oxidation iron-sulfur protein [Verrucomicrobiae bacterium]
MSRPSQSFTAGATELCQDLDHRQRIQTAMGNYEIKRDENKARFLNWGEARAAAAAVKDEAVNHLDKYLTQFAERLAARGTTVHWARDAREAREIIANIAREASVRRIIKSKSMTTEEIHLNEHLAEQGYDVFESDLGEFIVQLRHEPPYHLVFPSMHLTRHQISDTFAEKLGSARVTEPEELTLIARRVMREKFCQADMGISGVNFGIAETGMISVTENEGNARLTTALPRVHVALMGIEKILPRLDDLALFWPMLATAGAGQPMTCYNSLFAGPRQAGEPDGPEQFHVVLLDNGRTAMLADAEQRDSLRCIRCGACLNVCPVFRNVGGHTYGTVYGGPIGSVITPHLRGLQEWTHLSFASSLCGACTEVCPVKIDLAHHLLRNRRNAVGQKPPLLENLIWSGFACAMRHPWIYRVGARLARLLQPWHNLVKGSALDPFRAWTRTRATPKIAGQTFSDWWERHRA